MNCYTEKQVSTILGVSAIKLKQERMKGIGIPFVKIGKCVRYRQKDVDAYLEANCQIPEGYAWPEPKKASSEAISKPLAEKNDLAGRDNPEQPDWKNQVLDAMLENGIVSNKFSGKITLEVENGRLKGVLKQEEL